MAYIALYRKWRPALFEDVVGQRHITDTLQKAIETDKVAHAYLFSGPRGTGKTSTAKIFAKALNCIHGPTAHPCNECEVCRHITSGESLDVVEIDAASNRSIEDIRTLRETIKFMPAEGHKKIYIIDEVHMLTTEAFNALLKTLEEPPAHVVFILATTEPEKIPMTILSRCQRYEFRRITSEDIAARLVYVAQQEHIDMTKGAAHILAVQADGGMRDALSMLDQCVSNASGPIDEALVRNLLGLIGRDWLFTLSNAVFENRGDAIIKAVDDIVHMGKEPRVILTELVMHLRAVMLYQAAPKSDTLAAYADSQKELAAQAGQIPSYRVFAILSVLQQALLTARTSPTPRVAVEMGLLMAARTMSAVGSEDLSERVQRLEQQNVAVPPDLLNRITRLEQAVAGGIQPAAARTQSAYDDAVPLPPEPDMPDENTAMPMDYFPPPPDPEEDMVPMKAPPAAKPPLKPSIPARQPPPTAAPVTAQSAVAAGTPLDPARYTQIWKQVCQDLEQRGKRAVLSCMRIGHVVYADNRDVVAAFKTEFLAKRANKEDYRACVDEALTTIVGPGCHVRVFQDGDADLAAYQKKNSSPAAVTAPPPAAASPVPVESAPVAAEPGQPSLTPVALEDIPGQERDEIKPLLETLGECTIYVENK